MARKPRSMVFDAWSILAYLDGEIVGKQVADLIADAQISKTALAMSVIDAGEMWGILASTTSENEADSSLAELMQLGIEVTNVTWSLAREAASIRSKYHVSLSRCYAAALSKQLKGELVTGETEYKCLEGLLKIKWLAPES